jgi:hypothetical protein
MSSRAIANSSAMATCSIRQGGNPPTELGDLGSVPFITFNQVHLDSPPQLPTTTGHAVGSCGKPQ